MLKSVLSSTVDTLNLFDFFFLNFMNLLKFLTNNDIGTLISCSVVYYNSDLVALVMALVSWDIGGFSSILILSSNS